MLIKQTKPAIAMIELIFALVIMGIVLLSSPMLIQQSIQSGNVALQQESIAAAAAHAGVILSMHWDEANANLSAGTSPILDTQRVILLPNEDLFKFDDGNISGLQGVSGRIAVVGATVYTPSVTFGPDLNASPDMNESDFTSYDDIDDYDNTDLGIKIYNTQDSSSDIGDYVDVDLNMHTAISYVEDRPSSKTFSTSTNVGGSLSTKLSIVTNIKFIDVTLTSNSGVDELEKNITLKAFSCNIGTFIPQGDTPL